MMHFKKLNPKLSQGNILFEFEAIGTFWKIDLYSSVSDKNRDFLLDKIKSRIEVFDKNYSRFRRDSIIYEILQKPGIYKFPRDFSLMMSFYLDLYLLTDGLVTPLVGDLLIKAGYDAEYSLKKSPLSKPLSWDEVLEYKNGNILKVKKSTMLDFGAAGKGYLIDIIGELLEKNNIKSYCIDAGHDLLIKNKQIVVGLEHPNNSKQVIGIVEITNQSICGSAINRRAWRDMHHILNPKTQRPVDNILAVWVISNSAIVADGLATALFFVEPKVLLQKYPFEYVIVYTDYTFAKSANCPVIFYK